MTAHTSLLRKRFILVVDDDDAVRDALRHVCTEAFGTRSSLPPEAQYEVVARPSGEAMIERAQDVVRRGGRLELAIVDMRLEGLQGDEVSRELRRIDPSMRVMVLTGYADEDRKFRALNYGIDLYETKPFDNEVLVRKLETLLKLRRLRSQPLYLDDHTVIKLAETPVELESWFRLRKRVYVDDLKHVSEDALTEAERAGGMEFDDYDRQPTTDQVVCMSYGDGDGRCIAGMRGIYEHIPAESIVDLTGWRRENPGVVPAEASRFIIAPDARHDKRLLMEILRKCFDVSTDYPVKFCTTMDNTAGLYRLLGFVPLTPAPVTSNGYKLRGAWLPMMLDHRDLFRAFRTEAMPDRYREFSPELYNAVTTRTLHEQDLLETGGKYLQLFMPLWKRREAIGSKPVVGGGA